MSSDNPSPLKTAPYSFFGVLAGFLASAYGHAFAERYTMPTLRGQVVQVTARLWLHYAKPTRPQQNP